MHRSSVTRVTKVPTYLLATSSVVSGLQMDPIKSSPSLDGLYPLANSSSSSSLLLHVFQNKQTLRFFIFFGLCTCSRQTCFLLPYPNYSTRLVRLVGLIYTRRFCLISFLTFFFRFVKCQNTNGEEFCLCGIQRKENRFV